MSQSDIALRVEGLSKRYRLGLQGSATSGYYRYKSLGESLGGIAKLRLLLKHPRPPADVADRSHVDRRHAGVWVGLFSTG